MTHTLFTPRPYHRFSICLYRSTTVETLLDLLASPFRTITTHIRVSLDVELILRLVPAIPWVRCLGIYFSSYPARPDSRRCFNSRHEVHKFTELSHLIFVGTRFDAVDESLDLVCAAPRLEALTISNITISSRGLALIPFFWKRVHAFPLLCGSCS
jgi:hypothetical protein